MSENLKPYLEKWSQLIEKGYINSTMLGISNEQAISDFIAGNAAFLNGGPWDYNRIKESGLNIGFMTNVGESDEEPYCIGGPAANFGINVNTNDQEGAEAVLRAIASVEVQQAFVDANPGGFSYKQGVNADMPEEYAEVKEIIESGRVVCEWERWTNMPGSTIFHEIVSQLQGLISGDLSADDFLKALDDKADSVRYE